MLNKPNKPTKPYDILIERAHHYCKVKRFTENIATMFNQKNESLLCSKYLDIEKKMFLLDANKKMVKFCKFVQSFMSDQDITI